MRLIFLALNLLALIGLAYWIRRKEEIAVRTLFWPALILKLLAGIGLGLLYRYYYGAGDTLTFFDQGLEQVQVFKTNPGAYVDFLLHDPDVEWKGAARSLFFTKIVSLAAIVTDGSYWMTSLWFSFISFVASLYLFKSVIRHFNDSALPAAIAFLFFPSVVFWGSGVIKESLGLAGLMVVSGVYLNSMMKRIPSLTEIIFGVFSLWIVWNLKYYWMSVFLPVTCTSLVVYAVSLRLILPSRLKLFLWMVVFAILCLGVSLLHPNFYPEHILQVVIDSNRAFALNSDPENVIRYSHLEASPGSVLMNSPLALVSGLFRPFLWEADTVLKFIAALENAVILVLCLASLIRIQDFLRSPNRLITLSLVVYVAVLCIFLALSTPNVGSLARYRVGFLPFFVFIISYRNPLLRLITLQIH